MNTYETIDLNEYVRTGEGGTAITYTHKSRNTLAKLYNPGFEADRAVPEEFKRRALAFIEKVPEADTCLHGDLQIGNIIKMLPNV